MQLQDMPIIPIPANDSVLVVKYTDVSTGELLDELIWEMIEAGPSQDFYKTTTMHAEFKDRLIDILEK